MLLGRMTREREHTLQTSCFEQCLCAGTKRNECWFLHFGVDGQMYILNSQLTLFPDVPEIEGVREILETALTPARCLLLHPQNIQYLGETFTEPLNTCKVLRPDGAFIAPMASDCIA